MLLSHDCTFLRTAVLTEDVIDKLLQRYKKTSYTPDEIKKINLRISKELPGKEDLVTEWFLSHVEKGFGVDLDEYIKYARFFFSHYKEQLFKDVVREYNEENEVAVNSKNLFDFSFPVLNSIMELYNVEVEAKTLNILPDHLPKGSQLIYDDGKYQIVRVFGRDAACSLGRGTKWCTKEDPSASGYLSNGPLFVLYRDKKKWAQMHLGIEEQGAEAIEINDIKNKPFKINDEMRDALIKSGFMGQILEKIIHSNDRESMFLRFVGTSRNPYVEKECAKNLFLAYLYARFVIKGPFPAGERAIAQSPYSAMRYVEYALKRRFLEFEPLVIRSGLIQQYLSLLSNVNKDDASEFWNSVMDKKRERDETYYSHYVE